MTEPGKDTKGKAKVETADEDKSSSNTSSSSNEETTKCMDAFDFLTQKAKGIVIGKPEKSETETAESKGKAPTGVRKRRRRERGAMKRSISLRSGLDEIGMTFDSDSEPTTADVITLKEQEGEQVQEEIDVSHGSDTESDEVCKRIKKERNNDDDDDAGSGAGGATGAGAGAGAHIDHSSLGLPVAGK